MSMETAEWPGGENSQREAAYVTVLVTESDSVHIGRPPAIEYADPDQDLGRCGSSIDRRTA